MRSVICFLLIMVLCLSLACPAFAAAAPSIGNTPSFNPTVTPEGGVPRTGDMILLYVAIMIASLIALLAVVFVFRKKFIG